MRRQIRVSGVWLAALFALGGCATNIAYKPMTAAAPAAAGTVALAVKDARPADKGGSEKSQVGVIRGSYGIPTSLKDGDPAVVTRTVTEATSDALRHAGIEVKPGSGRTLSANVKHYWMDGMVGYKGTIVVAYSLADASGKTLWSGEVTGASGGAHVFKSGPTLGQDIFASALNELATRASEQFRAADFQQAAR